MAAIVAILDLDQNNFSYFWSTKDPIFPRASFQSIDLLVQEKTFKIDIQDGGYSYQLGFWIETISAIFNLHVIPMLPTKFQVNWPFGSGEEKKNKFSRWLPWWPSWISDPNDFSFFWSPTRFQVSWPLGSAEETKIRFVRWQLWWPSWISGQNDFSVFFFWSVAPMLPIKSQLNWHFGSGEEAKKDFQDGPHSSHLGFPIRRILGIFYLQVTRSFLLSFK